VNWQKADALQPETYADILPGVNGVVHTLGTLLEDGQYKKAMAQGDIGALIGNFLSGLVDSGNPLEKGSEGGRGGYEVLNRDSGINFIAPGFEVAHTRFVAALRVCETFLSRPPSVQSVGPRPFVFVSAEDIFRPFIAAKYINTKREAEQRIEQMMFDKPDYRGVYIRPSMCNLPGACRSFANTRIFNRLGVSSTSSTNIDPNCSTSRPLRIFTFKGPFQYPHTVGHPTIA